MMKVIVLKYLIIKLVGVIQSKILHSVFLCNISKFSIHKQTCSNELFKTYMHDSTSANGLLILIEIYYI